MEYKTIRELITKPKTTRSDIAMKVFHFGDFSIMLADNVKPIIVDKEIAEIVSNRKWCNDSNGYPVINLNDELVRLHDVVMAIANDEKPKDMFIDHINGDRNDNRGINLRFVSAGENSKNLSIRGNNKFGQIGVSTTKNGAYRAYITHNKKRIDLGHYDKLEDAIRARKEAEKELGFISRRRPSCVKERLAFICDMERKENEEGLL